MTENIVLVLSERSERSSFSFYAGFEFSGDGGKRIVPDPEDAEPQRDDTLRRIDEEKSGLKDVCLEWRLDNTVLGSD